ncbi:MAG: hypothetical protein EP310_08430 [Bacteroidetes bacterium]|nr:MAG: hypothetical protein EP310_08430 [Bacteroidota bacterium]
MEKIGKIVTILLWALLIVSAILVVSLVANINDVNDQDPAMLSWINANIVWVYILGITGAGLAVVFGLLHTLGNKEAAKEGIISLVFLGVVALVAFLLASPEIPQFIGVDKFIADGLTGETIKLVDAGLIATYILFAIAVLSIILGPVIRLVRN